MSVDSERPINFREMREFEDCTREGFEILGVKSSDDPGSLVEAVEDYVDRIQDKRSGLFGRLFGKAPDTIQLSLALGSVWGDQLVRVFNWEWTCVFDSDLEWYCVANEDRSLVVFPTYYVRDCIENPRMDCRALLSFNMLKEPGAIPVQPAKSYTNVMNSIYRIVPKGPPGRR